MRIFSGKYPGFAAMWRKLVLMYEKGPWRQKSGKYPDIFRSKALNVRPLALSSARATDLLLLLLLWTGWSIALLEEIKK